MFDQLRRLWRFARFVCETPQGWTDEWGHDVYWLRPWQSVYEDHFELERLRERVKKLEAREVRE